MFAVASSPAAKGQTHGVPWETVSIQNGVLSTPRAIIHLARGCGGLTSQHCRRLWTWGPGAGEAVRISLRRKIRMEVKIESMDETCLLQQRVFWDAPLGLPLGQVSSGDDGFSCSTLLVFRRVRSRRNSPDTPQASRAVVKPGYSVSLNNAVKGGYRHFLVSPSLRRVVLEGG